MTSIAEIFSLSFTFLPDSEEKTRVLVEEEDLLKNAIDL